MTIMNSDECMCDQFSMKERGTAWRKRATTRIPSPTITITICICSRACACDRKIFVSGKFHGFEVDHENNDSWHPTEITSLPIINYHKKTFLVSSLC